MEIYDQADGSLPTVLPMVVLDGVSGRERGREPFTENPKGYNGTYCIAPEHPDVVWWPAALYVHRTHH